MKSSQVTLGECQRCTGDISKGASLTISRDLPWFHGNFCRKNETAFPQEKYGGFWLVIDLPLWKMMEWVRQLGWWHSQVNGKIKAMFQTTNRGLILNLWRISWLIHFWHFITKITRTCAEFNLPLMEDFPAMVAGEHWYQIGAFISC